MKTQTQATSVIGVVFSEDRNRVLLVERRDVPVWTLPGGGIEEGESSEAAVIREILEETGFTVKVQRFVGLYLPINRLSKVTHVYECFVTAGTAQTSSETKDLHFFPVHQLPYKIPPPFPSWIQEALQNQAPIERRLVEVNYRTLFFFLLSHPILVLRFLLSRIGLRINSSD